MAFEPGGEVVTLTLGAGAGAGACAAAGVGAWIVRGERGEQWPVSAEEFRGRYEGAVE